MEVVSEKTSFLDQINTKELVAIAFIWFVGVVTIIANINSNSNLLLFQEINGQGISFEAFIIVFIIWGIFGVIMVYVPYIEDRKNGKNVILLAMIYYILAMVFWAFTLFHTEVQNGANGIASMLVFASNLWLAWACYHFNKLTILIFIVQFVFLAYIVNYSYSAGLMIWETTPFELGNLFVTQKIF